MTSSRGSRRPRSSRGSRARRSANSTSARSLNASDINRIDRALAAAERELKQMNSSIGLYKRDPGRYQPQIENLASAAVGMRNAMNLLLRTVDR